MFSNHSEAAAALETLHGRFVWPGARTPMVIVSAAALLPGTMLPPSQWICASDCCVRCMLQACGAVLACRHGMAVPSTPLQLPTTSKSHSAGAACVLSCSPPAHAPPQEWCDPSKQHKRKRAQPLAPAVLQHLPFQQQAMPCMQTLMPVLAAPPGLGQPMPAACSGQLVMSGY